MTTKYILPALIASSILGCSKMAPKSEPGSPMPVVANGQERGNGTDVNFDSDMAAWFVGSDKTFTYCLDLQPAFGPSRGVVLETIEESFKEWREYYSERTSKRFLAVDAKFVSVCDSKTDVRFIMGGAIPNGEKSTRHVGLAVKTSYDVEKSWGQGYIWLPSQGSIPNEIGVLPNWTPASLKGVLLHEIGHIYGVTHIDGTVMEENVGKIALSTDPNLVTPKIDGQNFLLPPISAVVGTLGLSKSQDPNLVDVPFGDVEKNFELLTGQKPNGTVTARVQFSSDLNDGFLLLTDRSGTKQYKLESYFWEKAVPSVEVKNIFIARYEDMYYSDTNLKTVKGFSLLSSTGRMLHLNLYYNQPTGFNFDGPIGSGLYQTGGITLKVKTEDGPNYLFTTSVTRWGTERSAPVPKPDETPEGESTPNVELSIASGGMMLPVDNQTCSDKVRGNGDRSAYSMSLNFSSIQLKWLPKNRFLYVGLVRLTISSPQIQGGSQVITLPGEEVEALFGASGQIITPDEINGNKVVSSNSTLNRAGYPSCAFNVGGILLAGSVTSSFLATVKVEMIGQATDQDGANPEVVRSTFFTTANYY